MNFFELLQINYMTLDEWLIKKSVLFEIALIAKKALLKKKLLNRIKIDDSKI